MSIRTIILWIDAFEWEKHRLETYYEKSLTIDDKVNEFNIRQIERKSKRIDNINNALDAIQNIILRLTFKIHEINPQNIDGTINNEFKEITEIITKLGYLYKSLETLHDTSSITINTFKGFVTEWREIKERMQPHHNPFTSDEEYLKSQFEAIDYFYDNYAEE